MLSPAGGAYAGFSPGHIGVYGFGRGIQINTAIFVTVVAVDAGGNRVGRVVYTRGQVVVDPCPGCLAIGIAALGVGEIIQVAQAVLERAARGSAAAKTEETRAGGGAPVGIGVSWNPPAGNPAACGGEEGGLPAYENSSWLTTMVSEVWVV